jgi:hypothetical protein
MLECDGKAALKGRGFKPTISDDRSCVDRGHDSGECWEVGLRRADWEREIFRIKH